MIYFLRYCRVLGIWFLGRRKSEVNFRTETRHSELTNEQEPWSSSIDGSEMKKKER